MASEVFRERPAFGVTVSGKPSTGTPPIGVPIGPQGFPPPPVPPPPPPPPPTPLAVVEFRSADFFGLNVIKATFDAPPVVDALPNWVTDGDPFLIVGLGNAAPTVAWLFFDMVPPSNITVPADATGILSASGGAVVPGVYPVF